MKPSEAMRPPSPASRRVIPPTRLPGSLIQSAVGHPIDELQQAGATACECHDPADAHNGYALAEPGPWAGETQITVAGLTFLKQEAI
jgi:hypothetical protein